MAVEKSLGSRVCHGVTLSGIRHTLCGTGFTRENDDWGTPTIPGPLAQESLCEVVDHASILYNTVCVNKDTRSTKPWSHQRSTSVTLSLALSPHYICAILDASYPASPR